MTPHPAEDREQCEQIYALVIVRGASGEVLRILLGVCVCVCALTMKDTNDDELCVRVYVRCTSGVYALKQSTRHGTKVKWFGFF